MPISRRSFLRAGASTGLIAALAACVDGEVHSAASNKPGVAGSVPPGVGVLPPAQVTRTKFAMVGDSITKASSKALTTVLEQQGYTEIKIEAEVSRRIAVGDGKHEPLSGVKTLSTMISDGVEPDVWAIAMGTNDVGKYDTAEEYGALIDQMMSLPDVKVPIVWVDTYLPTQLMPTRMFNLVLRDRAAVRGNATILSWFDLASNPSEKILRSDHIHPNEKGTLVFADLVSTAVAA